MFLSKFKNWHDSGKVLMGSNDSLPLRQESSSAFGARLVKIILYIQFEHFYVDYNQTSRKEIHIHLKVKFIEAHHYHIRHHYQNQLNIVIVIMVLVYMIKLLNMKCGQEYVSYLYLYIFIFF